MTRPVIADLVDLDRYPIDDLATPEARALVAEGRRQLAADGLFTLDRFIRPEAIGAMASQCDRLAPGGHAHARVRDGVHALGRDGARHPLDSRVSIRCVGFDRMDTGSAMRAVYEWDGLTRFIAAVFERDAFHRSADEMVGCMLTAYGPGDELGWHYDPNDGVVTLMIEQAEAGGRFEYAPMMRVDGAGGAEAAEAVMTGRNPARISNQPAGTLALFNGNRSLHRVSPVETGRRLMLVLSYHSEPGQVFDEEIRRHYFGRVA